MHPRLLTWFNDPIDEGEGGLEDSRASRLTSLSELGIPVIPGFIITPAARDYFFQESGIGLKISQQHSALNILDPLALLDCANDLQRLIVKAEIPHDLALSTFQFYEELSRKVSPKKRRFWPKNGPSSPTLVVSGHGGRQEPLTGEANLLELMKQQWALDFTPEKLYHRLMPRATPLIVELDLAMARVGKIYSQDPLTLAKNLLVIELASERIVINKESQAILSPIGSKSLSLEQITQLTKLEKQLARHFYFPHISQFVLSSSGPQFFDIKPLPPKLTDLPPRAKKFVPVAASGTTIVEGLPASPGLHTGPVLILKNPHELHKARVGTVLVLNHPSELFAGAIKKAGALILGRLDHNAYGVALCQKLGIPCVLLSPPDLELLPSGLVVTVDGTAGVVTRDQSLARTSRPQFSPSPVTPKQVSSSFATATKLYLDWARASDPDPKLVGSVDGVGILRLEDLIVSLGTHPKKVLADRTQKVFIEALANQLATIAQLFYPKPVICRLSDFQTANFLQLTAGDRYEPRESSSLLGFRGVGRHLVQAAVLQLEVAAILQVRQKLGRKNLSVMVPLCRTPTELEELKKLFGLWGLYQSPTLKLWWSCETPANLWQLSQFIALGLDGVAFNADSLSQLLLGVDKTNLNVQGYLTEVTAVLGESLTEGTKACHRGKVASAIYHLPTKAGGEDLLRELIWAGISALCVSAEQVVRTRELIALSEHQLGTKE